MAFWFICILPFFSYFFSRAGEGAGEYCVNSLDEGLHGNA